MNKRGMISQSGQGLIEAVLAIAVVMLITYALLNLGVIGLRNAGLSNDRVLSTRYLQEGIELLRAQRDGAAGWAGIAAPPH